MDKINFGHYEDQNPTFRSYMEDKILIKQETNYFLFAIFDGHGGDFVSNSLAEKFAAILKKNIGEGQVDPNLIYGQLKTTFSQADELFSQEPKAYECGSTAIVGLIFPDPKRDSSGFVFDKLNGYRLAFEHKASDIVEKNRVEKTGKIFVGRVEGILAITKAFGDFTLKESILYDLKGVTCEPWQWPYPIELRNQYEFIIFGSDGIWDVFNDNDKIQEMKSWLQEHKNENCPEISKHFLEEAMKYGSKDNLSIIVVKNEK